jgi:glycine/D-amino acid oxidase-like deaminating enzyme
VDTVERIQREQQIASDFRRGGKIKLAAKPAHYEKMAAGFDLLHREVGADLFYGAVMFHKNAQMHMGRFNAGLADAAARHGAHIYEQAPVTKLRRLDGAAHLVTTSRGTVRAKQVLIAFGASQKGPFFHFRRRIVPIGSFMIATAPLTPDRIHSVMPTRRNATTSLNIGHYFRVSPDNRLIRGGRARFALSSPEFDLKSGRILEAGLRRTFPQPGDIPIG